MPYRLRGLLWKYRIWALVAAVLAAVAFLFRQAIIEFLADSLGGLLGALLAYVTTEQRISPWICLLPYVALLILFFIVVRLLIRDRQSKERVIQSADLMSKLVPIAIEAGKAGKPLEGVVRKFLEEARDIFPGTVFRGAVLRPHPSEPDCLWLWVAPRHSQDSIDGRRFYKGPDRQRFIEGSVHGATFRDGIMRAAHFEKLGGDEKLVVHKAHQIRVLGTWVSELDKNLYPVQNLDDRSRSYESFVSIPVDDPDDNSRWGILAFDGRVPNSFETPSDFEALLTLGSALARLVQIYDLARQVHNPGQPGP